MIQAIAIILCAVFMAWGGACFHDARRYGIPLVLAGAAIALIHTPWAMSMLAAIPILAMGYGEKSPLRHCFGDGWGRGVWGFLVAMALSLGLFFTGHLAWYWFALYLALGFTLENVLKNIPQKIGDPLIGATFGLIICFIH